MSNDFAISLANVSKIFKRYHRPVDRLKEILLPGKQKAEEFWALQNINLEIQKGGTVGIIGRNGSGKSTLLQIIAGTLQPTAGTVRVNGRVSALLELGSGFNPEFTGRQNVFFNGRILGLSQEEIKERFDKIASFADIGEFINQPVKTYSSGMFVRLAFAVAVHVDPEVLIVDEALAVGDIFFQHRCMRRIQNLMESGVTTLFVSHDPGAIKSLCNWAVMLHDGLIIDTGKPKLVISKYTRMLTELEIGQTDTQAHSLETKINSPLKREERTLKKAESYPTNRRGDKRIEIKNVELLSLDEATNEYATLSFNQKVQLRINLISNVEIQNCIVGYLICDKNGNEVIGTNTQEEGFSIRDLNINTEFSVDFYFRLPLRSGTYSISTAVTENKTSVMSDWLDHSIVFKMLPPNNKVISSMVSIPTDVYINGQVTFFRDESIKPSSTQGITPC